jgi:hypothetical protein
VRNSRTGGLVAVALASVVVTAGCGGDDSGPVTEGEALETPYDGPLWVPEGREGTRAEAGAAGRALECDAAIYQGGLSGGWSEGDGGGTPEEGLEAFFNIEQPSLPEHGYRVEREEAERVLYSLDVAGETKVAVVVAKDRPDSPGWGPETSASCDPAELPSGFAEELGYDVWSDEDRERVPISEVYSMAGPEHCGWQDARFLHVGGEADGVSYARDPEGVLEPDTLSAPLDREATLPDNARDTGYRLADRDWELWLAADESTAYVRTSEGVEAWPTVTANCE